MHLHGAAAWLAALFLGSCLFGHNVALRLLLLAVSLALTALVVARGRGQIVALPAIWLPFLAWGAWAALSFAWSLEPPRTLKEWRNEVFYSGAALWVCFVGAQWRDAGRAFFPVVGGALAIACLLALYDSTLRPQAYGEGWHGGPGDHSSALLTLLPCLAMAGWYAGRARWPLWASAGIWSLVALVFCSAYTTLNRTVWIGFAIEFLLLGALILSRSGNPAIKAERGRNQAVALTVAAVAASVLAFASTQAERRPMGIARTLEQETRLALWPKVMEKIGERPMTGYGFGRGVLGDLFRQELGKLDAHLWHAHNIFLEALIQTGVPGLALLVLLMAALLRAGWGAARARDELLAAYGIALLAVVAGMLVRNMTDTLLVRQNALLFWGTAGVLLGLATRSRRASS